MFNVNIESVKGELSSRAMHRGVEHVDGAYDLPEGSEAYARCRWPSPRPLGVQIRDIGENYSTRCGTVSFRAVKA